jgi:hypothetical protein
VKTQGHSQPTKRADAYDPAHDTPSIRVSPKTLTHAIAHYNAKLPMDSVPMIATLHLRSQHPSRSRCRSICFVVTAASKPAARHHLLVPRQREYIARTAAQRQGGLPATECYNQGMSDKSAAKPMNGGGSDDGELS